MAQGASNPTTDVKKLGGIAIDLGAGNTGTGTQRVVIASNQAVVPVSDNGGSLTVDGTVAVTGVATETTLGTRLSESDFDTKVGSLTETAPASDTASSGLNGRLQRIAQRLTSLIALVPTALGQGTMATSFKVVLPSDQSAIPITDNSGSLTVDNAGTFVVQDNGPAIGIVTETAPASDTASSGLNGRLQRIAQRLTSLIALLPTALGQGTMAQSLRVVLPSDQASIPVAATLAAETTKVIGTINVAASQSIAVTQATATSLKAQAETYQGGVAVGAAAPLQVSLANHAANATAVKVDGSAVTQPVSIAAGLPAGTNLLGRESSSMETSTIYNATTALTPKFAFANVAASQTDSSVVAAVTSKKIRVLAFIIMTGSSATGLTFNSKPAGAGTAKTMLFAAGANGGVSAPFNQVGYFETVAGEGLTVTTTAGSTTGVQVVYVEV